MIDIPKGNPSNSKSRITRISAKKLYLQYNNLKWPKCMSIENQIWLQLRKQLTSEKDMSMGYLIIKTPCRKDKRYDIHVYLEFKSKKYIRDLSKLCVTLWDDWAYIPLTRGPEYIGVRNKDSLISELLTSSPWGNLKVQTNLTLPPGLKLRKNVIINREMFENESRNL